MKQKGKNQVLKKDMSKNRLIK